MFQRIGHHLLVLIAAMMVADPVMACCFASPLEATSSAIASTESDSSAPSRLPCHGGPSDSQSATPTAASVEGNVPGLADTDLADMPCPDCGLTNCDSVMSQEAVKPLALNTAAVDEFEHAASGFAAHQPAILRLADTLCLPQGPPPRTASTPVSLRQRLLI